MSTNIDPYREFVEMLSGVKLPPDKEITITLTPLRKKRDNAVQQRIERQKPEYDEETIFNDPAMIQNIKDLFYNQNLHTLSATYEMLNNWYIPSELAYVLKMPTYLYDQFNMLPPSIKNKTIKPVMKILKEIILNKTIEAFATEGIVNYEDQTWEEYISNEH